MKINSYKVSKRIGLGLLFVPIIFLLFFGIGEMFDGMPGGFIHFFQLLPILILLGLAWIKPTWAGYILILSGCFLGILYSINTQLPGGTIFVVELILFVMPVISGILLILSERIKK